MRRLNKAVILAFVVVALVASGAEAGRIHGIIMLGHGASAHQTGRVYGTLSGNATERVTAVSATPAPARSSGIMPDQAAQPAALAPARSSACSADVAQTVDLRTLLAAPDVFRGKCVTVEGHMAAAGIVNTAYLRRIAALRR